MNATSFPCKAKLLTDGWAGRTEQPVIVVGETPKRYRIRPVDAFTQVKLAGRACFLNWPGTALVPKHAVQL